MTIISDAEQSRGTRPGFILGVVIVLLCAFALLFGLSMSKRLDHDEHQFVTPAALLARRGLLPYRDYAYFHAPYLVFINAAAFRFCDHLLMGARLISMLCSFGTVSVVFLVSLGLLRRHDTRLRFLLALGITLLLMANPVFTLTSGRSWNHDMPTFFMILAIVMLYCGVRSPRRLALIVGAGILMGLAVGVRLSFAPPALACLTAAFIAPALHVRRRMQIAGAYVAGVLAALVPALVLLSIAPRQFIFGNFGYPALNTAYRELTHYGKGMTGPGKIWFVFSDVVLQPGSLVLSALAVVTALLARRAAGGSEEDRTVIGFLVFLGCATLIGAFAPTPLFAIYFFPVLPLLLLGILYLGSRLDANSAELRLWKKLVAAAVIASLPFATFQYRGMTKLALVQEWVPMRVHAEGLEIARNLPADSCVMTVAPLLPLEGGLDVYEDFATGPFALRIAPMIAEADEDSLKIADADDLKAVFLKHPGQRAVMTGLEPGLDPVLLGALDGVGLSGQKLSSGCVLWREEARQAR